MTDSMREILASMEALAKQRDSANARADAAERAVARLLEAAQGTRDEAALQLDYFTTRDGADREGAAFHRGRLTAIQEVLTLLNSK